MAKDIRLGDEIEDITSRQIGIAIGKVEYLSGAIYWIMQPSVSEDNIAPREQYIPDAYVVYKSDGVRLEPKPEMGFHARNEKVT